MGRTVDEILDTIAAVNHGCSAAGIRGFDGFAVAVGERLLSEIRRRDSRVPVIVFSSRDHAADDKQTALGLGARACVSGWSGLFQEIASVLE